MFLDSRLHGNDKAIITMLKTLSLEKNIFRLINRYSARMPQAEIETLLSHALSCTREELYLNNGPIDDGVFELCEALIDRRLSGEPLQHIISHAEFMGLDFAVNKDTFIPRPETEILVNEILHYAKKGVMLLDLCTGSGNIAISLARLLPEIKVVATDISQQALEIARTNASIHGVDKNVEFYTGDLFQALSIDKERKFDIIVCNPPYIRDDELYTLQKEVTLEPRVALDGGYDGLDFYRRIANDAPRYLIKNGALLMEIGADQSEAVKTIFNSTESFKIHKITKDFSGLDRVAWISLL